MDDNYQLDKRVHRHPVLSLRIANISLYFFAVANAVPIDRIWHIVLFTSSIVSDQNAWFGGSLPAGRCRGSSPGLVLFAKQLSPTGLELYTHQENHTVRALYERHGFVAVRYGISPLPESARC